MKVASRAVRADGADWHRRSNWILPPAVREVATVARMVRGVATVARTARVAAKVARMAHEAATVARMVRVQRPKWAMQGDWATVPLQIPSEVENLARPWDAGIQIAERHLDHQDHSKVAHRGAVRNHQNAKADWGAAVGCARIQMTRPRAANLDRAVRALHRRHLGRGWSFLDRTGDSMGDRRHHAAGNARNHRLRRHQGHRDLVLALSSAAAPFAS